MIDTALREQILKHQEQDEKLRPEGLLFARDAKGGHGFTLDGFWISFNTAADLITMAYLKRLYESGEAAIVIIEHIPDGWLAAAVAAYETMNLKPKE